MAITQTMTFSATPPVIGDTPAVFESRAIGVWNELKLTTVPNLNTAFGQMNTLETNINAKEATVVAKEALVSPHYAAIDSVAANATNINSVASTIVPNITEILLADTNAATATTQAGIATTKAGEASTSATNALNSANAAAALLDSFDDRYLGSKASEPTLDNDGNALVSGALYFNTTTNTMKVYDSVTPAWISLSFVPTDHGGLIGLGDDDHTQYHNDTRGDARYYTKTLLDGGQLDNKYYTKTLLDGGQLDNRYYTETETNTLLLNKSSRYYPEFSGVNSLYNIGIGSTNCGAIATIDATRALAVYDNGADTMAVILTVTGGVLSAGTPVTVSITQYTNHTLEAFTGGFLLSLGSTTGADCRIITISGSTITVGASPSLVGASLNNVQAIMLTATSGIAIYSAVTTNYPMAKGFTVSGTTITFGTALEVDVVSRTPLHIKRISDTTALMGLSDRAIILTLSGTTLSKGTLSSILGNGVDSYRVTYASATEALLHGSSGSVGSATVRLIISGNSITDSYKISDEVLFGVPVMITPTKGIVHSSSSSTMIPFYVNSGHISYSGGAVSNLVLNTYFTPSCYLSSGYMITIGKIDKSSVSHQVTLMEVTV